jgi:hypothetical protein
VVRVLDDAVRIPGTRFRVGLDPVLGLLPGAGDVLGGLLTGGVVVEAARLGVPGPTLVRMLGNLALDALAGLIPGVGDLVDAGWKANRRNLELLEDHLADPEAARRQSALVVGGVAAAVLLVVGGVALVAFRLAAWVVGAL